MHTSAIIPAAPLRPRVMPNPVPSSRKTGSFGENERGGASVLRRARPVSLNQPKRRNLRPPDKIRRRNADKRWSYPPHHRARRCPHPNPPPQAGEGTGGGSSPVGVPPRLSPKRLVIPKAQLQARFPGTRSDAGSDQRSCASHKALTGVTRHRLSQSRDAPPAPVIMPGD
jgi:hypothetical protein